MKCNVCMGNVQLVHIEGNLYECPACKQRYEIYVPEVPEIVTGE